MKKYSSKAKVTISTETVRDMRDTTPLRNPTTDGRIRD